MEEVSNKVAIICFLWGDWPDGNVAIGEDYIEKLRNSIQRNTTNSFDFIVFRPGAKGSPRSRYLSQNIPSLWVNLKWNLTKIFMFTRWTWRFGGYDWVVALDLDLVVTGNIDFLLEHRSDSLVVCRGAYGHKPGGSVVGFDPSQLWTEKLVNYMLEKQAFFESPTVGGSERKFYTYAEMDEVVPTIEFWQDKYPGKILSYKVDGYNRNASIIRFHGQPRPHEVEHAWLHDNWR